MRVALVFPGQGSQEVGMARALCERFAASRRVFELADQSLADDKIRLSTLCFEGPEEELVRTANTQPAILTASLACLAALQERLPKLGVSRVAGHSLGEYTALVASGALELGAAVRLVRLRGTAMQDSVAPGVGAMSAILMLDDSVVTALCEQVQRELPGRVVSAANFNSPGQVVVAGHADAVARVGELAVERRGRVAELKVSAPFHCALMAPAAEKLRAALTQVSLGPMSLEVVSNVDATAHRDASRVPDLLVRQVAGCVLWSACVKAMVDLGVSTFVEVGPGRVLSGLIKRIHKTARIFNVSDPESLELTATALETLSDLKDVP